MVYHNNVIELVLMSYELIYKEFGLDLGWKMNEKNTNKRYYQN